VWHVDILRPVSFAKLMQRFKGGIQKGPSTSLGMTGAAQPDPLRLATAAVLLDIAYADGERAPSEDEDIAEHLRRAFALDDEMAQELLQAAEEIRSRTIDHFALTNFIRRNVSLAERIEIVKTMWRIVYSDGKLTDYESYLVR